MVNRNFYQLSVEDIYELHESLYKFNFFHYFENNIRIEGNNQINNNRPWSTIRCYPFRKQELEHPHHHPRATV